MNPINIIRTLIRKTSLGAVVLLATMFALFNAPAIWGEQYVQWRTQLMIYLVASSYYYATTGKKSEFYNVSIFKSVAIFGMAFLVSIAFFQILPFEPSSQQIGTTSVALVFTHIFVVAANEEILFRAAIPDLLPIKGLGAQMVSAVLFGLFHWTAYGAVWSGIAFAIVAGAAFGFIYEFYKDGLIVSIAAHSAWNLYALGLVGSVLGSDVAQIILGGI